MQVNLTTYYTDGTSGITKIEKPPGAHPDSVLSLYAGICAAEVTGKTVKKIGVTNTFVVNGKPILNDDHFPTREKVISDMRKHGTRSLKPEHR